MVLRQHQGVYWIDNDSRLSDDNARKVLLNEIKVIPSCLLILCLVSIFSLSRGSEGLIDNGCAFNCANHTDYIQIKGWYEQFCQVLERMADCENGIATSAGSCVDCTVITDCSKAYCNWLRVVLLGNYSNLANNCTLYSQGKVCQDCPVLEDQDGNPAFECPEDNRYSDGWEDWEEKECRVD